MNRRVLLIGVVAAVAVVLLWFMLLWKPRQSAVAKAKKRTEVAEQQRSDLESRLSRLKSLKHDEPLKRSQLEKYRTAVPDQPNLAQFILDATEARDRSGIDFISITPTAPSADASAPAASTGSSTGPGQGQPPKAPPSISVSLQITGGYFQMLDFLNRLEDLPRILVIDSLNVTGGGSAAATTSATGGGGGSTASKNTLTVAIVGRMFVATVPATASAGSSASTGSSTTSTTAPGGGTATTTAPAAGGAAPSTTVVPPTSAPPVSTVGP